MKRKNTPDAKRRRRNMPWPKQRKTLRRRMARFSKIHKCNRRSTVRGSKHNILPQSWLRAAGRRNARHFLDQQCAHGRHELETEQKRSLLICQEGAHRARLPVQLREEVPGDRIPRPLTGRRCGTRRARGHRLNLPSLPILG